MLRNRVNGLQRADGFKVFSSLETHFGEQRPAVERDDRLEVRWLRTEVGQRLVDELLLVGDTRTEGLLSPGLVVQSIGGGGGDVRLSGVDSLAASCRHAFAAHPVLRDLASQSLCRIVSSSC